MNTVTAEWISEERVLELAADAGIDIWESIDLFEGSLEEMSRFVALIAHFTTERSAEAFRAGGAEAFGGKRIPLAIGERYVGTQQLNEEKEANSRLVAVLKWKQRAQAFEQQLNEQAAVIEKMRDALRTLLDGKIDYMVRNNLGNPYIEPSTICAVKALSCAPSEALATHDREAEAKVLREAEQVCYEARDLANAATPQTDGSSMTVDFLLGQADAANTLGIKMSIMAAEREGHRRAAFGEP